MSELVKTPSILDKFSGSSSLGGNYFFTRFVFAVGRYSKENGNTEQQQNEEKTGEYLIIKNTKSFYAHSLKLFAK